MGFRINVVSLYGAELLGALEHTLAFIEYSDEMAMQASGLVFQYDSQRPPGTRLDAASLRINGLPVNPSGVYRFAVNERIVALLSGLGLDVSGRVEETGLLEFNLVKDYMRELTHLHYTSEGRIIDVAALQ